MFVLVNYGLGNIRAFENIYKRLNIPVQVANNASELAGAKKIILPGVGAFDGAMNMLQASGMRECLDDLVLNRRCYVLGICVGMQIMARRSDEGEMPGLGWIKADVKKFSNISILNKKILLPHMGWNNVLPVNDTTLFKGLNAPRFYFLHSYYFLPDDNKCVLATTDYNGNFASAAQAGNIFGVQFHPEKSHKWGVQLLKNFAEL
jgi:glutamine amidotransferase